MLFTLSFDFPFHVHLYRASTGVLLEISGGPVSSRRGGGGGGGGSPSPLHSSTFSSNPFISSFIPSFISGIQLGGGGVLSRKWFIYQLGEGVRRRRSSSVISSGGPHRAHSGRLVVTPRGLSCFLKLQSLVDFFWTLRGSPASTPFLPVFIVHLVKFYDHDVI